MVQVECDRCQSQEVDRYTDEKDKTVHYCCERCQHKWTVTIEDLELMKTLKEAIK